MADLHLTFFQCLVFGHLLGDFVFQNTWMASKKGTHYLPCIVHCLIYTLCVVAMTAWNPWWALAVFVSHFPIDKYGLVNKWMKATRSRSVELFVERGHVFDRDLVSSLSRDDGPRNLGFRAGNTIALHGGYVAFAHIVVDNTLHLVLMLLAAKYLIQWGLM